VAGDVTCYLLMASKLPFTVAIISLKRAKHPAVALSPVWVCLQWHARYSYTDKNLHSHGGSV